ncbi:hypothetical protein ACQPW1_25610 [Nocardia sp. CA-128927]|uniref:hypothetical protein n=1 Tax=Nocardia sp. CA-128927 TaxID=3239975 RepID=UPI003D99A05D
MAQPKTSTLVGLTVVALCAIIIGLVAGIVAGLSGTEVPNAILVGGGAAMTASGVGIAALKVLLP